MSPFIRSGPAEVFKQIIRCYFCILWGIFHDIYKLAWSDPILSLALNIKYYIQYFLATQFTIDTCPNSLIFFC